MSGENFLKRGDILSSSEREIMSILFKHGPVPRSDIPGKVSISQQSVHRIIDGLHEHKLIRFQKPKIRGKGKPSPNIVIDTQHYMTLGISIGTEEVRVCVLDLMGRPVTERKLSSDPNNVEDVLSLFAAFISEWTESSCQDSHILGIGISMQGFRRGKDDLFCPPNPLSEWEGIPLVETFQQRFQLPSYAENNASSSLTAEYYLGIDQQFDCVAYLSFNFGFGAGLFVAGDSLIGGHGNVGEISSIFRPDEKDTRPALSTLVRRLEEKEGKIQGSLLDVLQTIDADHPVVTKWLRDIKPQLQLSLRALKAIADPNVIIFGGEAPDDLRKLLIQTSAGAFLGQRSPNPVLLPGTLKGDPSHLGAAFLPLHKRIY